MDSARQSTAATAAERSPAVQATAPAVVAPVPEAPPKRKRRPFAILGIVALIVVAAVGGYKLMTAGHEDTDDAQIAADMVPVATRVAGAVARVHIKENQLVKRGDLLIEIDPSDYDARVQQAAQAALDRLRP